MFEQYQIATDIARFTMMIHDGVDACKHAANGLDPDTGVAFELPDDYAGTELEFLQQVIRNWSNAALTNHAALLEYVNKIGLAESRLAVTNIFGVDASELRTFIAELRGVAQYLYNNVLGLTTMEQLATGANYIEVRIPQWNSIRRRWTL